MLKQYHGFLVLSLPKANLEKIVRSSSGYVIFSTTRSWIELEESIVFVFVEFHDGSLITTSIAVIRS